MAGHCSGKPQISEPLRELYEEEVGDTFFVLVNIAHFSLLDPEVGTQKDQQKNSSDGWSNSKTPPDRT